MQPALSEGDKAIVDLMNKDIAAGGIFVLDNLQLLFVKRLELTATGRVRIISENKQYASEEASLEEIYIVGRVLGAVKMF